MYIGLLGLLGVVKVIVHLGSLQTQLGSLRVPISAADLHYPQHVQWPNQTCSHSTFIYIFLNLVHDIIHDLHDYGLDTIACSNNKESYR